MATYLKRVQTVVSFSQLDQDDDAVEQQPGAMARRPHFGPTSAVAECPGHALPLFAFAPSAPSKLKYRRVASSDAIGIEPEEYEQDDRSWPGLPGPGPSSSGSGSCSDSDDASLLVPSSDSESDAGMGAPGRSGAGAGNLLDAVLTALWDDCAEQGLFRYELSSCATKRVAGRLGFVAQLNEGRATKKRATEFRVDAVVQPFDDSKFNFKKAYAREVLFQFEQRADADASRVVDSALCGRSPNLVVINVSPIEYGHVLLVPRVMDSIPQLVDPGTLALALHFAKEADSASFRVGYNSLGAYATINHLHFQAYYLDTPFACELADIEPVAGLPTRLGHVRLGRLAGYPVNGLVAELDRKAPTQGGLEELAGLVGRACVRMQQANVPHNLLISNCGRKVFIWPQCFAERHAQGLIPEAVLATGVNPAAFEIAGHVLLKQQADFDAVDEASVCAMLAQASLPEPRFLQVAQLCFGSGSGSSSAAKVL